MLIYYEKAIKKAQMIETDFVYFISSETIEN